MQRSLQPIEPNEPDSRVNTVCLVFKTHLDLGFTDSACGVRRRYLDEFFPRAIETSVRLDRTPDRFVWTTGSYILGEALNQADSRRRRVVDRAVRAGRLAWHAMPFTLHTELADPGLLAFGMDLSRELDRRYGVVTRAGKCSDVPGHTIGAVPVFAAAGLRFLHIGVNAASPAPDVPDLFRYGPDPDREILVLYQKGGYGAVQAWPDLGVALALAHAGDNHGPPSVDQVRETYASLRRLFPQARIRAGRLDALADVLWPWRRRLPAVREEIGDTWIHGAATDPSKIAAFRELSRLRQRWLEERRLRDDDPRLRAFSRALLSVAEHTWGLDMKLTIGPDPRYAGRAFAALRRESAACRLEASWREQRAYLAQAAGVWGRTAFALETAAALRRIRPVRPPAAGRAAAPGSIETASSIAGIDPRSGALRRLVSRDSGRVFADAAHRLGTIWFEVFDARDYARFLRQYVRLTAATRAWAIPDFGKPGLETVAGLRHRRFEPVGRAVEAATVSGEPAWRCRLAMPAEAVSRYGAPPRVVATWQFCADRPEAFLVVDWFDQRACRIPCAIGCSFVPFLEAGAGWRFDKAGLPVDPRRVVARGNRRLHAVGEGVAGFDRRKRLRIETLDAPLVAPGSPALLDFHQRRPSARSGIHVVLYNNLWGTNFPLWNEGNARFRFRLLWENVV